jgi:hypothetical protein
MGYIRRWSVENVTQQIMLCHNEATDFRNDGYVTTGCIKDLYTIKCLVDKLYEDVRDTKLEESWQQDRVIEILKK